MQQEEEIICDICQNKAEKPVSCSSCDTTFCYDCIKTYIFINKFCFTCNTQQPNLKSLKQKEQVELVESIFLDVQIPCYNHIYGCQQKLFLYMMDKHLQTCPFKTFKCQNCGVKLNEIKFRSHQKQCPNKSKIIPIYENLENLKKKISELELIYNPKINELMIENYFIQIQCQQYEDFLETGHILPIQEEEVFKKTILQCSKGHPLQWIKKLMSEKHICEKCKQPQIPLRYICQECGIYFCSKCKYRQNNETCPKNHSESIIKKRQQHADLQCDVCDEFIRYQNAQAFKDKFCDFVICSTCKYKYKVQIK